MTTAAEAGREPAGTMDERKVRALRTAVRFLLAGPALFLSVLFAAYPEHASRALGPLLVLALAAIALLLLRRGRPLAAARLLVYGTWAGLALAVALGGGARAPQAVAMPLAIILAGWLLGSRHAIALTALSVVTGLAVTMATHFALLPPFAPPPLMLVWIPFAVVAIVVCVLVVYIVHSHEEQLAENRMLSAELARRVDELAAEKAHLHLIAENVPALIFHGDADLRCRYANRQFADFFHGGGTPLTGMPLRDILGADVFEAALPNIRRVLAGEAVLLEGERKSAAAGERFLEISLVPERDAHGAVTGFFAMKRDITERRRIEQALAESEAQLRLVAENVPAMIAYNDRDLVLRYANARYLAFFGLDRRRAFGRHVREIIGESGFAGAEPMLHRVLGGDSLSYRALRRAATGEERMVEVDLVPDRDADGAVRGGYALMRDITDQQRAEDDVRRLNAELESRVKARTADLTAANRELESFAYSISHDLRAPLRGIDGFSQLLLDEYGDRLDGPGRGYLDRVRRAAQRMGTLIDDILELSRVSRHAMRHDPVDLSRLAHEILEELARAAPRRGAEIRVAAFCNAVGDPQLLRILLQNLLENAWKYSGRADAARIEFGCEECGGEAVFHVRDNGVGFDMQYASRLFSPFERLHSAEDFEGTGIGLATVARVVHRHGGRVWAESRVGEGATFRFTLG